jgi:branched-chain amino acid transport system permease protein
MEIFLLHLINGITLGAMYALVALGLSLVFGVVRLVNFAHGELFMLGGYALVFLYIDHGIPYPIAVVLAVVLVAFAGLVFERIVVRPVLDRSWRVQLVATLAASMIISNAAIHIWGSIGQSAPTDLSKTIVHIGEVSIALQRILVLIAALASFAGLALFVKYTKIGAAMRAMSQNREACVVYGIDIKRVSQVTFAIGSGLAALAGVLVTPLYNVSPAVGSFLTLKAFAAVVMGGLGQTTGVIYAAFILGIAEALFGGYFSFAYRDAAAFIVMILVLLLRPQGLFASRVGI